MANTLDIILNILKKGDGGEDAKKELSGVENAAQVAGKALMTYVSVESIKATYELSKLGAQSLRTKDAFEAISGGSQAASANLDAMREATRGAMSETDMMAVASQMLQMGLVENAEGLGDMTEMATRLGSAMGMEAGPAMENWNLMIANQSIPRLDSYGISASKVRTRMVELQAETAGMTREQAFLTAVTEEGTISMERLGPATDDAALSFERIEATAENLETQFAEKLAPAAADVLDTIMLLITANEQIDEAYAVHSEDVAQLATNYDEYLNEMLRANGITRERYEVLLADHEASMMSGEATAYLAEQYNMLTEAEFNTTRQAEAAAAADIVLAQGLQNVAIETENAKAGVEILADTELNAMDAASRAAAASRDLAAAEAEAAQQAAVQAENTADLAQSLKDATSGQIASRLIGMLDPEKMGADAYGAAVGEIGLQFGIMDEESVALAENMDELASAIEDGTIATEDADEALEYLIEDARDGQVDINNLMTEFSTLATEAESAGRGMERSGRGMEGIKEHAGGAESGLEGVGSSAGAAAGEVGALAGQLGTTESKLAAIVAGSPWTFSVVGSSGTTRRDIVPPEDLARFGGGGGASTQDNRQYSSPTTITNYITDPTAAAMFLSDQQDIIDRRIERGA